MEGGIADRAISQMISHSLDFARNYLAGYCATDWLICHCGFHSDTIVYLPPTQQGLPEAHIALPDYRPD